MNCFSVLQHSGKSNRCVFEEIITEDRFTQFRSAENRLWYIGFRKNGKPLKGYQAEQTNKQQCFQFLKTDFPYAEVSDADSPFPKLTMAPPDTDFGRKIVTHYGWTPASEKT